MESQTVASYFLSQEARAMLTRLERVMPFALNMPMVNAAAVSTAAGLAIEQHLARKRRELSNQVHGFLRWLNSSEGRQATAQEAQHLFTLLWLKFNTVLDQLDIFADVLTQRSEHEIGVWLAGLDVVAADALTLPGNYYKSPPLICYLDRDMGLRFVAPVHGCQEAVKIRLLLSEFHANAWSAAALPLHSCTK